MQTMQAYKQALASDHLGGFVEYLEPSLKLLVQLFDLLPTFGIAAPVIDPCPSIEVSSILRQHNCQVFS
jgi:hypothetical protein